MIKTTVILGSSRARGDTYNLVQQFTDGAENVSVVNLSEINISPFDYEHKNIDDDFLQTIEQKVISCENLVLATPVYWYTMSSQMKVFIDRISDLITIRKDLGRKLKEKKMYILACFAGDIPKGFELPFEQTCGYMDMIYSGCFYYYCHNRNLAFIESNKKFISFKNKILSS